MQIRFEMLAKLVSGYRCSLEELLEVTTPNSAGAAPWAVLLAAVREGRVRAGLPRRPDPDTVTGVDETFAVSGADREQAAAAAAAAAFADDEKADGRIRRSAFRPAR